MSNKTPLSKHRKRSARLSAASTIIIKIAYSSLAVGIALTIGFWSIMASNMGPAYLPHIMDGELDPWIRLALFTIGLAVWFATAIWVITRLYRNLVRLIKKHQ